METISVNNATKRFPSGTICLQKINTTFEAGKIYGIVGRNGSGKTVFLKCICGLTRLTEGYITVLDKQIGRDIDFPEGMGLIIENPGFIERLSGYQNLLLLSSVNKKVSAIGIQNIMKELGLDSGNKKPVSKYSLGMKQRLGIAQAIMENPDIIIFDEPFNNLDEESVIICRNLLRRMRESGKTILISTHNKEDTEAICDTVYRIEKGQLTLLNT